MSRPTRVLAVDDDPLVLEMLAGFLTSQGYEAVTAHTAGDAFRLIRVTPPHVILLDLAMPGVDGMTALRRICADHPEVPIIMLTGSIDLALAQETLKEGAFDYVAKPVDFDRLAQVIEAAVAHHA
jgi:DNA-binding NtrC family response regulator